MKHTGNEEVEALKVRINDVRTSIENEMDEWKAMCHLILESPESRLAVALA